MVLIGGRNCNKLKLEFQLIDRTLSIAGIQISTKGRLKYVKAKFIPEIFTPYVPQVAREGRGWKYEQNMMTSSNGNIFRVAGPLCGGDSPVTSEFPDGQWRGALTFSLICAWINGWVSNGESGALGRRRAHYDVTVMTLLPYLVTASLSILHYIWRLYSECW